MKKNVRTTIATTALTMLGVAANVHAEVKLTSAADVLGLWSVTAEALKYDGEKKALDITWEFKEGGILNTVAKDPRTETIRVPLSYSVEDGMLVKQSVPGRQKFETCTVLKKDATSMDIKCKFLYFFLTKK